MPQSYLGLQALQEGLRYLEWYQGEGPSGEAHSCPCNKEAKEEKRGESRSLVVRRFFSDADNQAYIMS